MYDEPTVMRLPAHCPPIVADTAYFVKNSCQFAGNASMRMPRYVDLGLLDAIC